MPEVTLAGRCVILGGGGHASVVIDALQLLGIPIHGILDSNPKMWGTKLLGVSILGGDDLLPSMNANGVGCFLIGVGNVGPGRNRKGLFEKAIQSRLAPQSAVHPSATCASSVKFGAGSVALAGSIINPNSEVGVN